MGIGFQKGSIESIGISCGTKEGQQAPSLGVPKGRSVGIGDPCRIEMDALGFPRGDALAIWRWQPSQVVDMVCFLILL